MTAKKNFVLSPKAIVITLIIVFVLLPVTLTVLNAVVFVAIRKSEEPKDMVVPQLVGLDIQTATGKAEDAHMLILTFPVFDSKEAPRTVVAQDPPAGEVVKEGTGIALHVSVASPATALDDMRPPKQKQTLR